MTKDFGQVVRELERGKIDPVYFLSGDEHFLQTLFTDKLKIAMFGANKPNSAVLTPDEMQSEEIVERLNRTDMFASKSLFILRKGQQIRSNTHREAILSYCRNPIPTNCLVILHDEFNPRLKFYKDVEKVCGCITTATPFDSGMLKWAQYFFNEHKISVSRSILETVVNMAGDNLSHLANEIGKLSLSLNPGEVLTVDKIEEFSGWQRENKRWEFILALGDRQYPKAVQLGRNLITQNETLVSLMYSIISFYQEIWNEKNLAGTNSRSLGYRGLPPSVVKRLPAYARNMSMEEVERGLLYLSEMDKRIKSLPIDDETELLKFIVTAQGSHGG